MAALRTLAQPNSNSMHGECESICRPAGVFATPLLDEAFLDARISWSRLLALLPIMQVETQAAWVEFATEHSLSDLRRVTAGCKPGDLPGDGIEDSGDYSLIHKHRKMFLEFTDVEYSQIDQLRMLMAKTTEEGEAKLLSDEELYLELVRAAISQRGGEPNASPTEDRTESQPRATPNQDEIPDEIREHVLRRDRNAAETAKNPTTSPSTTSDSAAEEEATTRSTS